LHSELGTPPRLDFVFLGLGPDAHTASLFPHDELLRVADRWVAVARYAPIAPRLTLTFPALAAAREVLFVVTGGDKADAVAAVHGARIDPARWPAQAVTGAHVAWLLDRDAAARLPPDA
jgi:6-phosphogluconolactonase